MGSCLLSDFTHEKQNGKVAFLEEVNKSQCFYPSSSLNVPEKGKNGHMQRGIYLFKFQAAIKKKGSV